MFATGWCLTYRTLTAGTFVRPSFEGSYRPCRLLQSQSQKFDPPGLRLRGANICGLLHLEIREDRDTRSSARHHVILKGSLHRSCEERSFRGPGRFAGARWVSARGRTLCRRPVAYPERVLVASATIDGHAAALRLERADTLTLHCWVDARQVRTRWDRAGRGPHPEPAGHAARRRVGRLRHPRLRGDHRRRTRRRRVRLRRWTCGNGLR